MTKTPLLKKSKSFHGETPVEPNTNSTDNTHETLLQVPKSSYSEIVTGQRPNRSVELQRQFPEFFSWDQSQTEKECLRLQHQQRIEAANQLVQKQEPERNQVTQQIIELNTEIQHDKILPEKNSADTFNSKKGTTTTRCKIWMFHS